MEDRPLVVAVDFDGTLVENNFPEIGEPNKEVMQYVRDKKEEGAIIILWTTRQNDFLQEALDFCEQYDIPIDYANRNAPGIGFETSNKIFADIYVDDRGYNPFGIVDGKMKLYTEDDALAKQNTDF